MSTVARTGENQAAVEELAGARALIERGEYGAALDALSAVSVAARARRDAGGLNEVRLLAEQVSARAPGRTERERADALRLGVAGEVDAAAVPASKFRHASRRWALIVLVVWLVVSVVSAALVAATSNPDGFISPGFLAVLLVLFFTGIALAVWLVGVLIIFLARDGTPATFVRRGWLGGWSVLVVAVWLVLSYVSAREDVAASRPAWAFIYLGLYGLIGLVVWLLGVFVYRLVARGRRRSSGTRSSVCR